MAHTYTDDLIENWKAVLELKLDFTRLLPSAEGELRAAYFRAHDAIEGFQFCLEQELTSRGVDPTNDRRFEP